MTQEKKGLRFVGTVADFREWLRIGAEKTFCPKCDHPVWDIAKGSKLNKCWGCGLAFD